MRKKTSGVSASIWVILVIVVLLVGAAFLLPSIQTCCEEPPVKSCQSNLHQFGAYAQLYRTGVAPNVYPPLDGGEMASNWGDFLRRVKINGEQWKEIPDKLYICPLMDAAPNSDRNQYWWADPRNKKFFPDGNLSDDLPLSTPIAGDAPNNHEGYDQVRNVLLLDGSVQVAEPGDELWERAYGENGALTPVK